MGDARQLRSSKASASSDAQKLLLAIAQAKKAAVTLKEDGDDDLPGPRDGFVLLFPDGKMVAATDVFMWQAALIFCVSQRFVSGLPTPKPSRQDLLRTARLLTEMRAHLRTRECESAVIPPPNWASLLEDA